MDHFFLHIKSKKKNGVKCIYILNNKLENYEPKTKFSDKLLLYNGETMCMRLF